MFGKKVKKLFLLFFVLGTFFVIGDYVDATTQTNQSGKVFFRDIMSSGGYDQGDRSLALDSNDYPHTCVYYRSGSSSGLRHNYWDGSNWQTEDLGTVGSSTDYGRYCSIAINKNNNDIHISYYNSGDLNYKKKSNGTWADTEAVDATGDTGLHTSIVLTSDGTPHIFYQYHIDDSNNWIRHAYWSGASWHLGTVVAGNVGQDISSAVDSSDNIHVSYTDISDHGIKYILYYSNGTWYPSATTAATTLYPTHSISIGSDNIVRIAYTYNNGVTISLRVANGNISGFTSTTYVSTDGDRFPGTSPSIVLDSQNYEHVSHYYLNLNYLGYAYNSASGIAFSIIGAEDSTQTSIAYGDGNAFISYYNTSGNNSNLLLMDSKAPTLTAEATGKAGTKIGWQILSSDYAKMGGVRYYCVDENNTCDPTIAMTSATMIGSFTASSTSVNSIYLRLKDWAGNTASSYLTVSASNKSEKEYLDDSLKDQLIVNNDLTYKWKRLPNNPTKYWMQTFRYKKYAPNFASPSKYLVKRYWKIKTNLYTYKKSMRKNLMTAESLYVSCYSNLNCSSKALKTYKNNLKKYQKKMFRVRVTFYYSKKIFNKLKSKNSDLKNLTKKQAEKKIWLKIYDKGSKSWQNINKLNLVSGIKRNVKKNNLAIDVRYFKQKNTLFTIGMK